MIGAGEVRQRLCSRTGVALAAAAGEHAWRVARTAYGPLNPPLRPTDGGDARDWGRFDTRGGRTLYGAASREGAYAEVLAAFKRRLGVSDPLAGAAAGLDDLDGTNGLITLIEDEWASHGHMHLGHLPRGWRAARALYELRLPKQGWWVELEHPDSLAAAEDILGARLAELGVESLTVATLRGEEREVTALIARWLRALVLDDGDQAHGIRFGSKHATGTCWAYWLRQVHGHPVASEALTSDGGSAIDDADADLRRVADRFGLQIW